MNPMQHGTVNWFSPTRGLGVVAADDGRVVFFRAYEIEVHGDVPLEAGLRVAFTAHDTDDGPEATHLHVLGEPDSLFTSASASATGARTGTRAASAAPQR